MENNGITNNDDLSYKKATFIDFRITKKITFASHQNDVPVLRELVVNNQSEINYENLELKCWTEPDFISEKKWIVDRLNSGDSLHIRDNELLLNGQLLKDLNEAVRGRFYISIFKDENAIAESNEGLQLLARNEWGGLSTMPELLAAFVLPNDPTIDKILHDTSEVLRRSGKNPNIEGYLDKSRSRVWEVTSAIWSVICSSKIEYALPPTSFEEDGQKIRSPSYIFDVKRSTCLDTCLLFAAALEQSGYNPVICFTKGHSTVGVWLQPEEFRSVVIDDPISIRKRIQLKELILFETTFATQQPPLAFSKAVAQANKLLQEENEDNFLALIDIKRARMQRIKPVLFSPGSDTVTGESPQEQIIEALEEAPILPSFDVEVEEELPETSQSRLHRWQRHLLDLSLRNKLLNYKTTKLSIPIECPDPGLLEDKLADGVQIKIVPAPLISDEDDGRSESLHIARTGVDMNENYALSALERNEIVVKLAQKELESRLVELYRRARSDREEGGANTLFLAIGFLLWKKDDNADRKYRAPLILVPVTLLRRSIRSGVKLVLHEDEPRFNTTLLQMLRQDFALDIKGLDGILPQDDHGIDVSGIWNKIKISVKEAEGFEVKEDVVLSTFSFAKFLMWKDLVDRTNQLSENSVVDHLIERPNDVYPSDISFPEPRELDNTYSPDQLHLPLPYDSSQISAVAASSDGKDFVLIGPPGTGKSQTIANIISHSLAEDKTVLFVSEKIAALNVVYRRLREIGLSDYCLELHSNKARKLDVLNQLRLAWDENLNLTNEEWKHKASKLKSLRENLNSYVNSLHKKYPNGWTPYEAIGLVAREVDHPEIELSWPNPYVHDISDMDGFYDIVKKLELNANSIGNIVNNEFNIIHFSEWSPQWQKNIITSAKSLSQEVNSLQSSLSNLFEKLNIPLSDLKRDQLNFLNDFSSVLKKSYGKDLSFVFNVNAKNILDSLEQGIFQLEEFNQLKSSSNYSGDNWRNLDIQNLNNLLNRAEQTWWGNSLRLKFLVKKELKKKGGCISKPDPKNDLDVIERLQCIANRIEELNELNKTSSIWKSFDTNIQEAKIVLELGNSIRKSIGLLASNDENYVDLKNSIKSIIVDYNELLDEEFAYGRQLSNYQAVYSKFYNALQDFLDKADNENFNGVNNEDSNFIQCINNTTNSLIQNESKLNAWCAWWRARSEALSNGLNTIVDGIEDGTIPVDQALPIFKTNYARWWSTTVINNNETLRSFVSVEHEGDITKFVEFDEEFLALTKDYIRASISGNLPSKNDVTKQSEFGILRRELEKKKRHKPLRQLIKEMPTALTQLTPCLLMSPLSIAQYLPPDQSLFDLVIFDEASQIAVWDAVGSIARAKQAIIVGDPKQLPPTNFFNRSEDDDDVDYDGDLESILDECLAAGIQHLNLNWHYRSHHESLIAFSNYHYYNGQLVTFPSPVTDDRAVRYISVPDGLYERAGARINKSEATNIVESIVTRLLDPTKNNDSIGVVTFNSEQQRLIEDLLDAERRKNPELDNYFNDEVQLEPVFVKNLETVQGDERDIIYFSITYAKDQHGNMSVNFGPLNRDGGERRLNVAITRARKELLVYSTLDPSEIDLSRTNSAAVRDLKHFLEFSQKGSRAFIESNDGSVGSYESPFEEAVSKRLSSLGWHVHPQIGVSQFRIDLGIVHPNYPGKYLAGVECDGATYHRSATARDRDKIRQQILENLGWSILRIWSTDWWIDSDSVIKKIDESLNSLLEKERKLNTDEENHEFVENIYNDRIVVEEDSFTENNNSRGINYQIKRYSLCDAKKLEVEANPDNFFERNYVKILSTIVDSIIKIEGPISIDLLSKRVARIHGFKRTGNKIRKRIYDIAYRKYNNTREKNAIFFWPSDTDPENWDTFRKPTDTDTYRDPYEICKEELLALVGLLKQSHSLNLVSDIAKNLGISRLSTSNRTRIEGIIESIF